MDRDIRKPFSVSLLTSLRQTIQDIKEPETSFSSFVEDALVFYLQYRDLPEEIRNAIGNLKEGLNSTE